MRSSAFYILPRALANGCGRHYRHVTKRCSQCTVIDAEPSGKPGASHAAPCSGNEGGAQQWILWGSPWESRWTICSPGRSGWPCVAPETWPRSRWRSFHAVGRLSRGTVCLSSFLGSPSCWHLTCTVCGSEAKERIQTPLTVHAHQPNRGSLEMADKQHLNLLNEPVADLKEVDHNSHDGFDILYGRVNLETTRQRSICAAAVVLHFTVPQYLEDSTLPHESVLSKKKIAKQMNEWFCCDNTQWPGSPGWHCT